MRPNIQRALRSQNIYVLEEIVLEGQERDYMKSVSVSAKGRTKKPSCEEDI